MVNSLKPAFEFVFGFRSVDVPGLRIGEKIQRLRVWLTYVFPSYLNIILPFSPWWCRWPAKARTFYKDIFTVALDFNRTLFLSLILQICYWRTTSTDSWSVRLNNTTVVCNIPRLSIVTQGNFNSNVLMRMFILHNVLPSSCLARTQEFTEGSST